ncbi:LysR substrate binding domain-containing protein [Burkholderia sp. SJZ115]|nr:LysR substrate binding domain-containing protein [Burkholderia sp. SJZ089]TWD02323.1 LysR substrate binding domain-containing protein [Burkholderia sp. SJZ115]
MTVPPAFADRWLLWRVESLQVQHPYYDLRIDMSRHLVDLTAERVDVAIRYGAGNWPDLVSTYLLRDDFFPVCSPALLEGEHALTSPAELRHHRLIHDTSMSDFGVFPTWRSWLRKAGYANQVDCDRGLQLNDSSSAYQAAISGNGVALGRTSLVERDLAEGRLVKPFETEQTCELAYYLVHRKGRENEAPVVAFREWLLAEVGA